MKYIVKPQKPQGSWDRASSQSSRQTPTAPLGEDRYKALLAQANAFFAAAEPDFAAQKAAAIAEINALMAQYQLTIEDLRD